MTRLRRRTRPTRADDVESFVGQFGNGTDARDWLVRFARGRLACGRNESVGSFGSLLAMEGSGGMASQVFPQRQAPLSEKLTMSPRVHRCLLRQLWFERSDLADQVNVGAMLSVGAVQADFLDHAW